MQPLRRLWLQAHRWMALCLGWLLILAGITGALLVVARPLDRWQHPHYFQAAADTPRAGASLESIRQKMVAEFGDHAGFTFRPPRQAGETLQVLVRSTWRGTVYINPVSGREQGRRGENDGLANVLYGLHSSLLMGTTGKALLAWAALSYLVLLATGLALWWPRRWPPSLRIEFGKGLVRTLYDAHRAAGATLALLLAVSIATGAFLAWRPIGGWISSLSGAARTPVPVLAESRGPMLALDELAARAHAAFPDGTIGYIMIPPQANRPVRVRMRLPDEPHPNGVSVVWLQPGTGAVLSKYRWDELDPGSHANAVIYPLHTGELGGAIGESVVAFLGLMLAMLGCSGLLLWWRRRAIRRKTVAAARTR